MNKRERFPRVRAPYFWETVSTRYKIMNWLTTIIFVAIIASILGALNSKDKEKEKNSFLGSCWRNELWLCYFRNIFSRRWIDTFI